MRAVPTTLPTRAMDTIAMPAQSTAVQPEEFQRGLIEGMERALLREPSPPCLLRAPTGSGKTFVISQVLERVSAQRDGAVVLVCAVCHAGAANRRRIGCQRAVAVAAQPDRWPQPGGARGHGAAVHRAGRGACAVAHQGLRRRWRRRHPHPGRFIHRARAQGLQVGLVVDEAHIGVDKNTEFGKFAHWLNADYLVMATATPKDERLNEFLTHAGYSAQQKLLPSAVMRWSTPG